MELREMIKLQVSFGWLIDRLIDFLNPFFIDGWYGMMKIYFPYLFSIFI